MKATALIAEDEPLLAQALRSELAGLWPQLEVVAVVSNGIDAQRDVHRLTPDVAFLDVRMPGASGVEVAQAIAEDWAEGRPPPLLAFVTAYEQFAVAAFEQAAVDYVLKPVSAARLARTVERLQRLLRERRSPPADAPAAIEQLALQLRRLLQGNATQACGAGPDVRSGSTGAEAGRPLRLLRAGVGDTVKLVRLEEVAYLQAADKYVAVVTADGELLIRESLRELMPRLDGRSFVQVHRSTVVNLDHVVAATRDDAGKLWLQLRSRPERVAVSRLHAHLFRAM
jgi:DNA-binding LytR/AlgR family response regulator